MENNAHYDVLIIGSGLAGLTLARQVLLASDKRVLMVERRPLSTRKQKVGEATVQMSGYYYARVLGMEEHLLQEHYLKYNLRFWWKTQGGGSRAEEFSQSYIRSLSNIATYQLDRNKFEDEVLRVNLENPRFTFVVPTSGLEVDLTEEGPAPHAFRFRTEDGIEVSGTAGWVVDASGRGRFLAKKLGLLRRSPIRHGTTFFWVDGLVDPEKLTDLTPTGIRLRRDRAALGHLPTFLATNHFCGDGWWFWVIPLHGKTSLGLVYDADSVRREEVATPEKLLDWLDRELPLFGRDLRSRKIVDWSGFADFAHDCAQTLSPQRWGLVGEACRFTDPLYSPGGDLISLYNTLMTDAILTEDPEELARKVRLYEPLARSIYEAYVPSYAVSYNTLGDQEAFSLRYVWELAIYFGFYVFPFVNDLFTDVTFVPSFLKRFSRLGPINRGIHALLADFHRWKRQQGVPLQERPAFFEFTSLPALREAEKCFYKIGVSAVEARRVLDEQLANFELLARFVVAQVASTVLGDEAVRTDRAFVEGIDIEAIAFDPAEMGRRWATCAGTAGTYDWGFDPHVLRHVALPVPARAAGEDEGEMEMASMAAAGVGGAA